MKTHTLLVGMMVMNFCLCQNLVKNPSFEEYTTCPTSDTQVDRCKSWIDVEPTSEYYNCEYLANDYYQLTGNEFVKGHSGNAYLGVSCFRPGWGDTYREYVGSYLKYAMVKDKTYYVEFWVLSDPHNCFSGDAIGALFTINQPVPVDPWTSLLPYDPQISNPKNRIIFDNYQWMKVCGTFTAKGGENFITLGSFKNDKESVFAQIEDTYCGNGVHWVYMLIDDVMVIEASADTNFICDLSNNYDSPENRLDPVSLKLIDSKLVNECELQLSNVLTPDNDHINDEINLDSILNYEWQLDIYNRWGNHVFKGANSGPWVWNATDNKGNDLPEGTYYYIFRDEEKNCFKKDFIRVLRN